MQSEKPSMPAKSDLNEDVAKESNHEMVEATLAQTKAQAKEVNSQIAGMMSEIRNMRSIIESQLAEISWGATQQREPIKSKLLSTMLTAGFSPGLSKQLIDNLPEKQTEAASKNGWSLCYLKT